MKTFYAKVTGGHWGELSLYEKLPEKDDLPVSHCCHPELLEVLINEELIGENDGRIFKISVEEIS